MKMSLISFAFFAIVFICKFLVSNIIANSNNKSTVLATFGAGESQSGIDRGVALGQLWGPNPRGKRSSGPGENWDDGSNTPMRSMDRGLLEGLLGRRKRSSGPGENWDDGSNIPMRSISDSDPSDFPENRGIFDDLLQMGMKYSVAKLDEAIKKKEAKKEAKKKAEEAAKQSE